MSLDMLEGKCVSTFWICLKESVSAPLDMLEGKCVSTFRHVGRKVCQHFWMCWKEILNTYWFVLLCVCTPVSPSVPEMYVHMLLGGILFGGCTCVVYANFVHTHAR